MEKKLKRKKLVLFGPEFDSEESESFGDLRLTVPQFRFKG
tara:strand:+ start:680 stop:799 length:120 start_codon:yes stop_codon:yes gene_type:complete